MILVNTKSTKSGIPSKMANLFNYINNGEVASGDEFLCELNKLVESLQNKEEVGNYMTMQEEFEAKEELAEIRGRKEGQKEGKLDDAKRMLAEGLDAVLVCKCTGLTAEEVANIEQ